MTPIKRLLLCISAGALLVCLGLFSTASADHVAPGAASITAPAADQPVAQPPSTPAVDQGCGAQAPALTLTPDGNAVAAGGWCEVGSTWTCCRCGGCGCRPQNISPTNWCGC